MRSIKYIFQFLFFLTIIIIGIYFGSENVESIRIVWLGSLTDPVPVWFVVLITFFIGAALSGLYFSFEILRLWVEVRRLRKEIKSRSQFDQRPSGSPPAFKPPTNPFGTSKDARSPFSTTSPPPAPRFSSPFSPPTIKKD